MSASPHLTRKSKLLSYALRHAPHAFGITLERGGWVSVHALLEALDAHGETVSQEELVQIVTHDEKQRFALDLDSNRIRANQGHSVSIELGYVPTAPPRTLYHGTVERFWQSIQQKGLHRGERHHVHLSESPDLARQVGARRGRPLILEVRAEQMAQRGFVFFRSANGVWLTEHVPPEFLRRTDLSR